MRDYITLGPAPCNEDCVQVSSKNDYWEDMLKECKRFRQAIEGKFPPPDGAHITVKRFPHDFGTYAEVAVVYDDEYPDAVDYAFMLESKTPATWRELE